MRASRPWSASTAAHPASARIPRLVLHFVVVTAICFGLASAAVVLVTRHLNTVSAEETVARQAEALSNAALAPAVRRADLERRVTGARRDELDGALRRLLRTDGVTLVAIAGRDAVVTYATDTRLVGKPLPDAASARQALAGTITSKVTTTPGPEGQSRKALGVYVPIAIGGKRRGTALVLEDYGPVDDVVGRSRLVVTLVLWAALVLLFLVLVPVLHRAARQLRRQVSQIERQAYTDPLTELPNRLRFADLVRERRDTGEPFALVVVDVDGFREINDTLGHERGDELLVELARRLRSSLDGQVVVARLGSDEFGFLASAGDRASALAVASQVRELFEEVVNLGAIPIVAHASVGLAWSPEHGSDPVTLQRLAEVALARAKATRVGIAAYEAERDTRDPGDLALIGELRSAIEQGQLVVHYQPQTVILTGAVTCLEALVRWQHPTHGLLPPDAFVPLAEKTALGRLVTREVMHEALAQCGAWRSAGYGVRVAVNVTMPDLLQPEFAHELVDMLVAADLDPDALELEITETTLMADRDLAHSMLERLATMGIRLAIDDFGTGYSSFERVATLPVQALKIDRTFVGRMTDSTRDRTLVRCALDLARNLGLETVAEGVETEETLRQLRALGCDFAQGFLIQRPTTAEALEPFLAKNAAPTLAVGSRWVRLPAVG